jgi:hypothetical protein
VVRRRKERLMDIGANLTLVLVLFGIAAIVAAARINRR